MSFIPPSLVLGTAMWGWTTPAATAFALLDEWYDRGLREVDTATNYPIDKDPGHFRLAEQILQEWIRVHGISDLQVMQKIGSVNNLRSPEHILTRSFVLMMLAEYQWLFGSNLTTLMVHWDNRDDATAIGETLEAFDVARQAGLQVGISGIQHPEIYAEQNKAFGFDFRIQLKHNVLQSDYRRYTPFHGCHRFIAYGINAGGLKLDPADYVPESSLAARKGGLSMQPTLVEDLRRILAKAGDVSGRPPLSNMNEVGMIYAFYQPDMQGILLGTSSPRQLKESLAFYETLKTHEFQDVFSELKKLGKG